MPKKIDTPKKNISTPAKRDAKLDTSSAPERAPRRRSPATSRNSEPATPREDAITTPTEDQIRVRAYYFSLERNGDPADPVSDWLRAERDLITGASES